MARTKNGGPAGFEPTTAAIQLRKDIPFPNTACYHYTTNPNNFFRMLRFAYECALENYAGPRVMIMYLVRHHHV